MKKITCLFIAISFSLWAQIAPSLDDLMPQNIQKSTGVAKLTSVQKEALAKWLVHFREGEKPIKMLQKDLSLSENLQGGKILKLTDGSVWEVAPQDVEIAQTWLLPFKASIESSGDPAYPCKIVNKSSGSSVRVRRIDIP